MYVLILVLVEHALGGAYSQCCCQCLRCLNPCFSGTCSRSKDGIWRSVYKCIVLILVLVEHALGDGSYCRLVEKEIVLILVLVEHALGVDGHCTVEDKDGSLNPCFSGTCSRSYVNIEHKNIQYIVLILVLVEHALGGEENKNFILWLTLS